MRRPSSETSRPNPGARDSGSERETPPPSPDEEWASREVAAMAAAWERGERITAEEVIERHPDLDPEAAIRLIYEEVCLRREAGLEVSTAEVVRRFPHWKDELEVLFGCDRLLRPAIFPEVGETLGSFRLLAELGRGASGRTFLARDPNLADRPVVLKVIPSDQQEHLALARLQHTHIVPLFSEHAIPDRGLRALCMPYLGGASLAQVLTGLSEIPRDRRHGAHWLEIIDRHTVAPAAEPLTDSPYRRYLAQASHVEAVCWIAACLADALQYAHSRGLVHMDIKPSNVLIASDGQPMLLDFHLARGPIHAGDPIIDRLGGTPGWMSPEQKAGMDALENGRPVARAVDGRSDLYSLGLLVLEALGSEGTKEAAIEDRLRPETHSDGSAGLAAIVNKCVAPNPFDRYDDAATLADDLRRHLNDLPLHGVANRDLAERWRKWRRRSPATMARAVAWMTGVVGVVIIGGLAGVAHRQRVHEIRIALEDGRHFRESRHYAEAVQTLKRGQERAEATSAVEPLKRSLDTELRLARRAQRANDLHDLADLIRFRYCIALPSGDEARVLLQNCRAIWDERGKFHQPGEERLDAESEQRLKTDLLELAVVWADLRVYLASPDAIETARQEARSVLDEAERSFGPSPSLTRLRQRIVGAPDRPGDSKASLAAPRSAWEHYDLGRSYLREGRIEPAAAEFQRALAIRPQDFWPNFYQGLCAFRLGQFEEAVAAFRTSIALVPDAAVCHFNRGLAYDALNQRDRALHDYTRAIELDPSLAAARLNRGILFYKNGQPVEAGNDFETALRATSASEIRGRLYYNLALADLARDDRAAALHHAEKAVNEGSREAVGLFDDLRAGRFPAKPKALFLGPKRP